ncbi:hypothetical protein BVI2075_440017 [Burkholderia vietnamiensis]|nr:hypothetical protein BVI2075_440017 [Burkholderia vietnamiensis]
MAARQPLDFPAERPTLAGLPGLVMRLRPARDVVPATDIGALFDQATDAHRSHPDEHACNRAARTSKSTPPDAG